MDNKELEKVEAICLKTYPDEDDMQAFCEGKIDQPSDVRIYYKGKKYKVVKGQFNPYYYKLAD